MEQRRERPARSSRLASRHCTPKKKVAGEKLRVWRIALMRSRLHYLGVVYAPDERSAEAAAVAEFKIGGDQRRRLIVRPDDD